MSASCKEAFWVSFLGPRIFLMQKLSPDKLRIHRDPFQQQNSTKAVRLVLAVNWSSKDWLFKNFQEPSVFRDKKKITLHITRSATMLSSAAPVSRPRSIYRQTFNIIFHACISSYPEDSSTLAGSWGHFWLIFKVHKCSYTHTCTDSQDKYSHLNSFKCRFKTATLGAWHLPELFASLNKDRLLIPGEQRVAQVWA